LSNIIWNKLKLNSNSSTKKILIYELYSLGQPYHAFDEYLEVHYCHVEAAQCIVVGHYISQFLSGDHSIGWATQNPKKKLVETNGT
jgi:hypothetical protein